MELLWIILIGAVAGWLAGQIFKGRGLGLLGNIVVGILGAIVGEWVARKLGIHLMDGLLGRLLTATGGAIILLFLVSLIKKA